ncbi:MAG: SDR family oxidoreductase [Deltaproteobacteria bacterium]|nr:SDR family oxidoreductase [Deltaproteobacteria bacterium]
MTQKAVVTGGAGFIGSHMVDRLLAEGHQVTVIDNFSTGRRENLNHCKNERNLTLIEADVSRLDSLIEFFKGVDWVFHFAALGDIVPSINKPAEYYHANVTGTFNVLEASRKEKIGRFIYAASSSCYGIPDEYPTKEDAEIRTEYPYALAKFLGERLVLHWGKVYKLPVVSMRFFNVYGPRSRTSGTYGAAFGVFLAQKLNGHPYTVVGDGRQTRDFTFVTDVVNACVMAAKSGVHNEVFNVGSGGTYSVNQLVGLLGGEVVHIPKRPGEPDCTFADISKIRRVLGWEPSVRFEEGVKIMLENISYWKKAPLWSPEKIEEATRDWFKYLGNDQGGIQ